MTVTSKTIEHIKVSCRNTAGALASALTEVPLAAQLVSVDTHEDRRFTDVTPHVWLEARFEYDPSIEQVEERGNDD